MKKILLLIAIITIVSCAPEKKVDYAIISGKIENSDAKKITIYSQFDTNEKKEISLGEDGTFTDTLKMNTDFYLFREDKNMTSFFAPKGSAITIEYNSKKKDSTLNLKGNESTINNYLFQKEKIAAAEMEDQEEVYLKNEEDFKVHLLKIKTAQEALLANTNSISEDFKKSEIKNINYDYLSILSNYQPYHGYYIKDRAFKTSENFLDELKNIDLENESDFLFSQGYRSVVNNAIRNDAKELVEKDSIADDIAYLKLASKIKNDKIRNKLLFDLAKYGITYTDDLEEFYQLYSEHSTNTANNSKIEKDYKKIKALSKGNESPKFTDYENYAGGNTSLDDLKGKFVYVDVWATWCGPCIAEIPSLKKLEKEYHGKNIEFVSISIDKIKDHEKWKKMIVEKELKGTQLFADNNWDSQFVTEYLIKGIPRFILIDPQGNIVNSNAPRPSDEKLTALFSELKI